MKLKAWHFVVAIILFSGLTRWLGIRDLRRRSPDQTSGYLTELDGTSVADSLSSRWCFVLFYQENSEHCDKMEGALHLLAKNNRHRTGFFKLNPDNYPEYGQKYTISGVPTTLILHDGKEVARIMGVVSQRNLEIIYARTTR
ncbi:thioredoxin family protein [Proteiniphilum sp.]|uniref:thioredoxin family protein n=1 Tax=Proteiniphilum sp. TaxID=1926877 RepID=UPI00332694B3